MTARGSSARKLLFLHVPKTSGTSLGTYLRAQIGDVFTQANAAPGAGAPDPLRGRVRDLADIERVLESHAGLILHVDAPLESDRPTTAFRSLAHLLFAPEPADVFRRCTILTMLRHPFACAVSSYHFVRRQQARDPGFLPDLRLASLDDYLGRMHDNAVLHFLVEPDLARRRVITRGDLERVTAGLRDLPIHAGLYERHADSVRYFGRCLGRNFSPEDVKTMNAAPREAAAPAMTAEFADRHALDLELYATAAALLAERLG